LHVKRPADDILGDQTLRFPLNGGSVALVKLNENQIPLINFGAVSSLFRDAPMADDWRKFAAAAVNEKDSAKIRVLVEKLIEGAVRRTAASPTRNREPARAPRPGHGKERFGPLHPVLGAYICG